MAAPWVAGTPAGPFVACGCNRAGRSALDPYASVGGRTFALIDARGRAYFGYGSESRDHIGLIEPHTRSIFGRSYAAEPPVLIDELAGDEAIAAAETMLLTVPNRLGIDCNAHVIEAILTHVAPALGWR